MPQAKSGTKFIATEYNSNPMLYVYLSRVDLPGVALKVQPSIQASMECQAEA